MNTLVFRKWALAWILLVLLIKLVLAACLQLSNDEVYYLVYARSLQWNYFDHPPMVALVLKIASMSLFLQSEIFLRLGFIICGVLSGGLLFKIGAKLYNPLAGWLALLLFSASVYGNIISGFMVMPDGPMLVFWLWAILMAVQFTQSTPTAQGSSRYVIYFGVASGLAIMSKVTGVFLWIGLGAYILVFAREWLKSPYLYLAMGISLIIAAPIIWWNFFNSADGAAYHANRIAITAQTRLNPDGFFRQFAGEWGYNNPICYVLSIMGLLACWRKSLIPQKIRGFIGCFSVPLILSVWLISWFKDTLPHWTGPAFVVLLLFAAVFLAHKFENAAKSKWPPVLQWANGLVLGVLLLIVAAVYALPMAFNAEHPERLGKGDLFLDFSGWKQFSKDFQHIYSTDWEKGNIQAGAFIISDYWFPAAHLDWYVASPAGLNIQPMGDLNNIHQYAWLNLERPALQLGKDAYYIRVSNYYRPLDRRITQAFEQTDSVQRVPQLRNGVPVRYFYINRLKGYKGGIPPSGVLP